MNGESAALFLQNGLAAMLALFQSRIINKGIRMASSKTLELTIQAKALADMADEWAAMGSDNITVNDLRQRAGRFRQKSRELSEKARRTGQEIKG